MINFGIQWWIWFNVALFALLAIDLKLVANRTRRMSYILTGIWISIAILFALFINFTKGHQLALEFVTGYLIEESLSVDNLFVFLMLFHHFHVPHRWQTKILMYGIIGALVMRFIFIVGGIAIIQQAHWVMLIFGAFLVFTGIMMFKKTDEKSLPKESFIVKLVKKVFPYKDSWDQNTFFVTSHGKRFATPAFITLCAVESTDLVFALDSIPAVFAITLDPFIVYSCNALAIVGLRSLFFVLKDALMLFEHLHHGVSIILVFVGSKMLIEPVYHIDTPVSLGVIGAVLAISLAIPSTKKKDP